MIEKRFTIEIWQEGSLFYKDDKEGFSTHNSTSYVTNLVENKLNELSCENEQLKQENKHLRCTIESNSQDDYIDYLKRENEQLKQEGANVERLIDDLGSEELRRQYDEIINGDNDDQKTIFFNEKIFTKR